MVDFAPIQTSQMPIKEKIIQRLWNMIRPIVWGCSPFFARKWRRKWLVLCARLLNRNYEFSKSISISQTSRIDFPWRVSIGDNSSIGERTWVYALDSITIGQNCCIGDEVMLLTGSHDVSSPHFDLVTRPITIGDNVWLATRSIIMGGVKIGEGAVVAAGSVVTKDVAPWIVVGGNPAKQIKKRELIG